MMANWIKLPSGKLVNADHITLIFPGGQSLYTVDGEGWIVTEQDNDALYDYLEQAAYICSEVE